MSSQGLRQELLDAISAEDSPKLQQLLATVKPIPNSPYQALIENQDGSPQLTAGDLIAAAARSKRDGLRSELSQRFPSAPIPDAEISDVILAGDAGAFKLLLAHDPSLVNHEIESSLDTTLTRACIHPQSLDIAFLLLDRGADPNLLHRGHFSPLYWAIKEQRPMELVERLVERGANLSDPLAMFTAAREGRVAEMELFLEKGLDPGMKFDREDRTLISEAEAHGQKEMVRLLKERHTSGAAESKGTRCCMVM